MDSAIDSFYNVHGSLLVDTFHVVIFSQQAISSLPRILPLEIPPTAFKDFRPSPRNYKISFTIIIVIFKNLRAIQGSSLQLTCPHLYLHPFRTISVKPKDTD